MTTYLDGVRLRLTDDESLARPTGVMAHRMLAGTNAQRQVRDGLDQLIQTSTVAGIELYTRNLQAPPEYQTLNGNCGVILIWTR